METRYTETTGATHNAAEELLWKQVEPSGAGQAPDVTVSGRKVEAMVHVQKGASVDLLLGTDFQPQLGISLTANVPDDNSCDLLQGLEHQGTGSNPASSPTQGETHAEETTPTQSTL